MIARMNPQQLAAFDVLYTAITSASPAHTVFYLDGKAGHGKSFVASALCTILRSENHIPIIVGTTAVSVRIYETGRTAHSAFGLPVSVVCPYLQP
jgi:tRNA A37 threonylcarbamoyladenosine biosynthesis protein TsaE